MRLRAAAPDEGERLREIAFAAKSYWGYDRDRVRQWVDGGDFSPEAVRGKHIVVAEAGGRAIAWAQVLPKGDVLWLDDLWVEPDWIGAGVGSLLFREALERGRDLGAKRLEWEAEPNAVGFYERMGGRFLRTTEPNEWGRVLDVMGVDLT